MYSVGLSGNYTYIAHPKNWLVLGAQKEICYTVSECVSVSRLTLVHHS